MLHMKNVGLLRQNWIEKPKATMFEDIGKKRPPVASAIKVNSCQLSPLCSDLDILKIQLKSDLSNQRITGISLKLKCSESVAHSRQNSVFSCRCKAVGRLASITWIVQVPFVPCPRILQSFGHKELIVVCGGFMVWRGLWFHIVLNRNQEVSLYFQPTGLWNVTCTLTGLAKP